jgi:hypothetical protein
MSCTRCGAALTPGAKFCPACGKAVPPEATSAIPAPGGPAPAGMAGFVPVPQQLPGAAPVGAAVPIPKSTNGLAIASMVLGIVWIYWLGSILALIFGYVAKGQIDRSEGRQGGRGMAIAGIVLGWVGIGMMVLGVIAFIVSKPH